MRFPPDASMRTAPQAGRVQLLNPSYSPIFCTANTHGARVRFSLS